MRIKITDAETSIKEFVKTKQMNNMLKVGKAVKIGLTEVRQDLNDYENN